MSEPPMLTVVRGQPTEEEIAALVTVLGALSGRPAEPPPPPVSQWAAYWRQIGAPLVPGPDAWRNAAR